MFPGYKIKIKNGDPQLLRKQKVQTTIKKYHAHIQGEFPLYILGTRKL